MYIKAGAYVPTAKTFDGPPPPSRGIFGKESADGIPFCPSALLLVFPSRAIIPSRPGIATSKTAIVLSVRNPVP